MSSADKVKNIIVDKLGVEESRIVPEASFLDDLGADSLDTVELIMQFEEEFEEEREQFAETEEIFEEETLSIQDKELELIIKSLERNNGKRRHKI